MDLIQKFSKFIQAENLFHPADRLLVAVSGGIDSVVLCALCKQAGYQFSIAHCNFKLRGEFSDRDERFVQELARRYDVPFFVKTFETTAHATFNKQSIEEAARTLRYEWFHQLVTEDPLHAGKFILTAHHADDNIETVVMNFFRGTGISGLRGILPKQGNIVRPILFANRTELEAFGQHHNLDFVTDHTNLETVYTRNYFRHKIIPLIAERFPSAAANVLSNIQRFRDAELLYHEAVQLHKKKLMEFTGNEVHIPVLKLQKTPAAATVMHEILKDYGFTAHQVDEAMMLLKSESGKFIQSLTHRVIRNRKWLIISPRISTDAANILIEAGEEQVSFPGGILKLHLESGTTKPPIAREDIAQLDARHIKFPLLLRRWKQGDYFYPLGMQKKKKLSRFLIDKKRSLSQKENTWVLEMDKKILWVLGLRIDDRFKLTDSTTEMLTLQVLGLAGNQPDHSLK